MAHSNTYIDQKLPLSVERVAAVTGNPMIDPGWQCSDSRPYFLFKRTYYDGTTLNTETVYTTLSPNKSTAESQVSVYMLQDGSPVYVGTGTQNGTTVIFNGHEYTKPLAVSGSTVEYFKSFVINRINKWAKCKPIRYPQLNSLSPTQRIGTTAEQNAGYWYGVKFSSVGGRYQDIHEVDFDYHRPSGGDNEPYRIEDFCGYDHNAVPNIYCSVAADEIYTDEAVESPVELLIDTNGNNTTGVDFLTAVMKAAGAGSIESAFSNVYAIVMIDNYGAALHQIEESPSVGGSHTVKPIYSDGTWNTRLAFTLYDLRDLIDKGMSVGEHTLSVFLVWGDNLLDKSGTWQKISDRVYDGRAFALPGATGLVANVVEWIPTAPAAMVYFVGGLPNSLNVGFDLVEDTDKTVYVRVSLRIGGTIPANSSKVVALTPNALSAIAQFRWREDLGLVVTSGMTISDIDVTIVSWIDESKTTEGQGRENVSVTIP